jgi:hypothetical protein
MYRKLVSTLVLVLSFSIAAVCAQPPAPPTSAAPQIKGQYLETRSADVYVGQCFANGEMNTAGQEAIVAWHIGERWAILTANPIPQSLCCWLTGKPRRNSARR